MYETVAGFVRLQVLMPEVEPECYMSWRGM
jgi:hypothetical protein